MNSLERALFVAKTFKVKTGRDKAVVVSAKYMQEQQAGWAAYQFGNRQKIRFEDTPCYRELKLQRMEISQELTPEQIQEVWRIAKKRFYQAVLGNLVVFAAEDESGTEFLEWDLPMLLSVNGIRQINGINKFEYAKRYL